MSSPSCTKFTGWVGLFGTSWKREPDLPYILPGRQFFPRAAKLFLGSHILAPGTPAARHALMFTPTCSTPVPRNEYVQQQQYISRSEDYPPSPRPGTRAVCGIVIFFLISGSSERFNASTLL